MPCWDHARARRISAGLFRVVYSFPFSPHQTYSYDIVFWDIVYEVFGQVA